MSKMTNQQIVMQIGKDIRTFSNANPDIASADDILAEATSLLDPVDRKRYRDLVKLQPAIAEKVNLYASDAAGSAKTRELINQRALTFYKGGTSDLNPDMFDALETQIKMAQKAGDKGKVQQLTRQKKFLTAYLHTTDINNYRKGGKFVNGLDAFLEDKNNASLDIDSKWLRRLAGQTRYASQVYDYGKGDASKTRDPLFPNTRDRYLRGEETGLLTPVIDGMDALGGTIYAGGQALHSKLNPSAYPNMTPGEVFYGAKSLPTRDRTLMQRGMEEVGSGIALSPLNVAARPLLRKGGELAMGAGGALVSKGLANIAEKTGKTILKGNLAVNRVEKALANAHKLRLDKVAKLTNPTKGVGRTFTNTLKRSGYALEESGRRLGIKAAHAPEAFLKGLPDAVASTIIEDAARIGWAVKDKSDPRNNVWDETLGRGIGLGALSILTGWSKLNSVVASKSKAMFKGSPAMEKAQKQLRTVWEAPGGTSSALSDTHAGDNFLQAIDALKNAVGSQLTDLVELSGDLSLTELKRDLRANAAKFSRDVAPGGVGDAARNHLTRDTERLITRLEEVYKQRAIKAKGAPYRGQQSAKASDIDKSIREFRQQHSVLPDEGVTGKGLGRQAQETPGTVSPLEGEVGWTQKPQADQLAIDDGIKKLGDDTQNKSVTAYKQDGSQGAPDLLEGVIQQGDETIPTTFVSKDRQSYDKRTFSNRELVATPELQSADKMVAEQLGGVLRKHEQRQVARALKRLKKGLPVDEYDGLREMFGNIKDLHEEIYKRTNTKVRIPREKLVKKAEKWLRTNIERTIKKDMGADAIDVEGLLGEYSRFLNSDGAMANNLILEGSINRAGSKRSPTVLRTFETPPTKVERNTLGAKDRLAKTELAVQGADLDAKTLMRRTGASMRASLLKHGVPKEEATAWVQRVMKRAKEQIVDPSQAKDNFTFSISRKARQEFNRLIVQSHKATNKKAIKSYQEAASTVLLDAMRDEYTRKAQATADKMADSFVPKVVFAMLSEFRDGALRRTGKRVLQESTRKSEGYNESESVSKIKSLDDVIRDAGGTPRNKLSDLKGE